MRSLMGDCPRVWILPEDEPTPAQGIFARDKARYAMPVAPAEAAHGGRHVAREYDPYLVAVEDREFNPRAPVAHLPSRTSPSVFSPLLPSVGSAGRKPMADIALM